MNVANIFILKLFSLTAYHTLKKKIVGLQLPWCTLKKI